MAGVRKAYAFQIPGRAGRVLPLLGVATPLTELVHFADAVAAWWRRQDQGRRLPLRAAPLDVIFEALFNEIAGKMMEEL